jgi:hypothetical protein
MRPNESLPIVEKIVGTDEVHASCSRVSVATNFFNDVQTSNSHAQYDVCVCGNQRSEREDHQVWGIFGKYVQYLTDRIIFKRSRNKIEGRGVGSS